MDPWADYLQRLGRPVASCQCGSGCAGGGVPALRPDSVPGGLPFQSDGAQRFLPDQPQGLGQPRSTSAFPGNSWMASSSNAVDPRGLPCFGQQFPQGVDFGMFGAYPNIGVGNTPAPFLATGSPIRTSLPTSSTCGAPQGLPPQNPFSRPTASSPPTFTSAAAAAASLGAQYSVNPCATPSSSAKVRSAFEVLGVGPPARTATNLDQGERFIQAISGEKRPLPTWNGQPATMRSWLKLLAYWEIESTVPKEKWGLRLYQSFPEGSKPRQIADQIGMQDLLSVDGYSLVLSAIIAKYRPFLEVAGPAAIDRFLYSGERAKGESFANYIAAKEVARQEVESAFETGQSHRVSARAYGAT